MCLFFPKREFEFLVDGMYVFFLYVKRGKFSEWSIFFIDQTKISAMYLQKFLCYIFNRAFCIDFKHICRCVQLFMVFIFCKGFSTSHVHR